MEKIIVTLFIGAFAGFIFGYSLGREKGWWECFRSFEKHSKYK